MKAQNLLYIFTKGPYSTADGQEGLDALLMGAAFEQIVSVLFVHDGVFQINQGQQTAGGQLKQFTKAFMALEDFGVDHIYVSAMAIQARGLSESELSVPATALDHVDIVELIASQQRVFTF
jgi:tRNA 2-thiouridine synthesizing protein C